MKSAKEYWLLAYVWRRSGSADYYPANDTHTGSLSSWFDEMQKHNDEYTLLNAIKISQSEFKRLHGIVG